VICNAGLDNAFFIAIWTGGDCCPTGPCLQRALDGAKDDYETPEAVCAYADRISRVNPVTPAEMKARPKLVTKSSRGGPD